MEIHFVIETHSQKRYRSPTILEPSLIISILIRNEIFIQNTLPTHVVELTLRVSKRYNNKIDK